jgi:hypothetical protein
MSTIGQKLAETLPRAADRLRKVRAPEGLTAALEGLARQVEEPCLLAVIGRMKAGKSTLINALLGTDAAKVGVTETTATMNHFRYGNPTDPERPIRCHWRGGRYEDVGRAFLDSLQGHQAEAMRRAEGIDYLEYFLPIPYLREATLVDTPGTAAVVDQHQDRTAEFLKLRHQLRERHNRDTLQLGQTADAVLYLTGPVPRATDQDFLEEFNAVTGRQSRALNAVGVLAQIDLQPEVLAQREQWAARLAAVLKGSLNTIVPVSAGLERALDQLQQEGGASLSHLIAILRQIPAPCLRKLLSSDELYLEAELADCPVPAAERRQLLGSTPWGVFTTVARVVADAQLDAGEVLRRLKELSGFTALREVLERHFFKRSRFLRCYRILNEARQILNTLRYRHLPQWRRQERAEQARRERFIRFIRASQGDATVARELEEFVSRPEGGPPVEPLEATLRELDRELGQLHQEMEEYNADFAALEQLENQPERFSDEEREELRQLLGLYGMESKKRLPGDQPHFAFAAQRQQCWGAIRQGTRDPVRSSVAERAESRYGWILADLAEG